VFRVIVAGDGNSLAAEFSEDFAEWVARGLFWEVGPEELEEVAACDGFPAFDDEVCGDAVEESRALRDVSGGGANDSRG